MKHLFHLTAILFAGTLLFTSCKKDDAGSKNFDPNNPEGYMVAGTFKHSFQYPTVNQPLIMKFLGDNKIEYTTFNATVTKTYRMSNDTFYIDGSLEEEFVIKNGVLASYHYATDIVNSNLALQKVPSSNQLEGKTFTGKYYNPNGSVLHNSFFYSYIAGPKLNAGYNLGTIVRTNDYTNIGNIASRSNPFAGHTEFTMLLDGKLYSTYFNNGTLQYGRFDQQ